MADYASLISKLADTSIGYSGQARKHFYITLDTNGKDHKEKYFKILRSKSGGKELNDFADGSVSFVISGFQFALGCMVWIGSVMEEAVG
jgi:hypothetical protein